MKIKPGEKFIPIVAARKLIFDLTGVQRCNSTIYKWAKKGCRTFDGRIVKLETVKKLKQIFTTKQAIETFIREVG